VDVAATKSPSCRGRIASRWQGFAVLALSFGLTLAGTTVAQDRFRVAADTFFFGDDNSVTVVAPQTSVRDALDDDGGEVWARGVVDVVSAASVSGTPFAVFSESLLTHSADVSLTQVLGERWLARVAYALTVQEGYLETPYRYVPLFVPGALAGPQLDLSNFYARRLAGRPAEHVPDERVRHALALRLVALPRLYDPSDASFWRRAYVVSSEDALPRWRSVDRDLSSSTTISAGVRLEWGFADDAMLYLDVRPAWTTYHDFLFLDHLSSIVAQGGFRWTP
jgi:hypothetical protein